MTVHQAKLTVLDLGAKLDANAHRIPELEYQVTALQSATRIFLADPKNPLTFALYIEKCVLFLSGLETMKLRKTISEIKF